jgi:hypothetical protein
MNAGRFIGMTWRTVLLGACLVATACTTIGAPLPRRPMPAPAPAPTTMPTPPPGRPEPSSPRGVFVPDRSGEPAPAPAPTPNRTQSDARSASSALLAQSRSERAAGSYAQATASIERALRLDPNNAELWVERGELALQTGNAAQAATMARKALTLTSGDRTLTARAERLLRAAGAP